MRYQREVIERLEAADKLMAEAQSMCEVDQKGFARSLGTSRSNVCAVKNRVQNS